MSWLNLSAAWWLLLVPALLALYMLRAKPQRRVVSSLRLWRNLPDIDRPKARIRRPPLSLLLLLQAILLAAGAVALMKPALTAPAAANTIILLDASGSMQAADGGSTRFDRAKDEARRVASGLGSSSHATLLRVGPRVTTLCASCTALDLRKSIDDAEGGAGQGDWTGALSVASGLAASLPGSTDTVIITDGAFDTLPSENLPGTVRFVSVGGNADNRAITEINARVPPDGSPGYEAYARVENYGGATSVDVTSLADTVPQPDRHLDLPAGGHADLVWQLPAGTQSFTVAINGNDALNADNRAVLFLPGKGHKVRIVSPQSDLYSRVLSSIPGLEPSTSARAGEGDLAFSVVQGSASNPLPPGSLLLVSPQVDLLPSRGNIDDAHAQAGGATHPLLQGVDLRALYVLSLRRYEVPPWLETVLDSDKGPLILAGEHDGQRIAVFTFDPIDSNLPKLAAFPLLMSNLAEWLYPLGGTEGLRPGDALRLQPGATVNLPGGKTAQAGQGGEFFDTEHAGVYEVAPGTTSAVSFAVNMAGTGESDLAPRPHPELDHTAGAGSGERVPGQGLWTPLIACALFLVGAEWFLYSWKRGSA